MKIDRYTVFRVTYVVLNLIVAGLFIYLHMGSMRIHGFDIIASLTAYVVASAAAYTDIRYGRIPDVLIATGVAGYIVALIAGRHMNDLRSLLMSTLITALVTGIVCFLANRLAKGSVGRGDLKLLTVMALLLGWRGMLTMTGIMLLCVLLMSMYLIMVRHVSRKTLIPLAPAILLGVGFAIF